MSLLNQEPLQITDEKLNKILDLLAELRLELDPIVSALTDKQKRRMLIMGDRTYPFVKKTI